MDRRSHSTPGRNLRKNAKIRIVIVGPIPRYRPPIKITVSSRSRRSCAFLAFRQCRMIGTRSMPSEGTTARCEATSSLITVFANTVSRYAAALRYPGSVAQPPPRWLPVIQNASGWGGSAWRGSAWRGSALGSADTRRCRRYRTGGARPAPGPHQAGARSVLTSGQPETPSRPEPARSAPGQLPGCRSPPQNTSSGTRGAAQLTHRS